eukprot:Rmarinus@m.3030
MLKLIQKGYKMFKEEKERESAEAQLLSQSMRRSRRHTRQSNLRLSVVPHSLSARGPVSQGLGSISVGGVSIGGVSLSESGHTMLGSSRGSALHSIPEASLSQSARYHVKSLTQELPERSRTARAVSMLGTPNSARLQTR